MNIVVYTKSGCPNCVTAKRLLDSKGIGYFESDCDNPDELGALLERYPEARQMPQIFIEGQRVGGLAGLQAALKELGLLSRHDSPFSTPWPSRCGLALRTSSSPMHPAQTNAALTVASPSFTQTTQPQ